MLRIRLIAITISILAGLIIARLYQIQIILGAEFAQKAEKQYVILTNSVASRGNILLENKNGNSISAATIVNGFTAMFKPSMIKNPEKTFAALNSYLELQKKEFMDKAAQGDDLYKVLARNIETEKAIAIQKNIPEVVVKQEHWRYYPGGKLAAHVLGFVGYDGETAKGRYGVERYYDDMLSKGRQYGVANFFAELFADIALPESAATKKRADLALTLEPSVQASLELALKNLVDKWSAKTASGVIIDPATGAIYAMAAEPTFDPNYFNAIEDARVFVNPLVENIYEMGSIMKPITMAVGLETKAVTPFTTYYDNGSVELDGYQLYNFDKKARGKVNMQEILNQSLNTGAVFVQQKIGSRVFADYLRRFGLGEETGIDLPNETYGLLKNLDSPRDVEYATASFGQGIALTPIAVARAMAALGNGGLLITPHVVKNIKERPGATRPISLPAPERVISKETSEEITRMLVKVVDEALLGGSFKMKHYSIAAKTGTAQIALPNGKGYYDDRYLHAFFGYFPAFEPRFLILLLMEEPKEVRYAANTLTEPFMQLTKYLINYYEVPPDR